LRHSDETRFHDQRNDYCKFIASANIAVSNWAVGEHDYESVNQLLRSFEIISLIAGDSVKKEATEIHGLLREIMHSADRAKSANENMLIVSAAMARFNLYARSELKIENPPTKETGLKRASNIFSKNKN
jgi:hypothetical protein